MCYKKPGPRCSRHAIQNLEKAKAAFDADKSPENHKKYSTALEEYKTSPAGIKELQESGDEEGAQYYKDLRASQIQQYKASIADEEEEEQEEPQEWNPVHHVPAEMFDAAQHQIELANRRLVRNGIEERFELTNVERYQERQFDERTGQTRQRDMVKFQLTKPSLKIGGWKVTGRVDVLADGSLIAMNAPDQELGGWRPEHQACDHCGTHRRRTNTYLLKDDDGNIKQVGSNCLESFTGIRPEGLWALEYDFEDRMNRRHGGGWGSFGWQDVRSPQNVIQYALVLSDNGRSYHSRNAAEIEGRQSTGQMVGDYINPTSHLQRRPEYRAAIERIYSENNQALAEQVLEYARQMPGNNDYSSNLRSLSNQDYITPRHYSFVASAVAAWRREQDRQSREVIEQQTFPHRNEWVGNVGDRLTDIRATVTGVRYMDGQYGTTTLVSLRDEGGHTLKWFASGRKEYANGADVLIERATVKKHDEYRDTKQTVLTRCKVTDQSEQDD